VAGDLENGQPESRVHKDDSTSIRIADKGTLSYERSQCYISAEAGGDREGGHVITRGGVFRCY
jgi:hypothetical protein